MIPLYTPAQVRAFDAAAIAAGTPSLVLMERAAGHLARAVREVGGRGYGLRVGILCGKGNNGGDGLALARRLRGAGAVARVWLVEDESVLTGDAAEQLRRWRAVGGRIAGRADEALRGADVAVDCLLGTGATGPPRPAYAAAIKRLGRFDGPVVACDLPSGVDADSGQVPGPAVTADVTVTLGAHKRGLHLWPARGLAGRLVLGDLGLDLAADQTVGTGGHGARGPVAAVLDAADVSRLIPAPRPDAHKRSRGVVVILAGSQGMSGAATLVARAAMAAGAGLVTVATPAATRALVAPAVPEALTVGLPDDEDAAFAQLVDALEGADALAVGPGLGHAPRTVALVRRLVREVEVPVVLDADGLNAFRDEADLLADHRTPLLVCTPHARELARLVGSSGHGVYARRATLVLERAAAWNAVVVAKGPGSLVAAPDGRAWVNPTGGPGLAVGGTGDVLTGVAVTLVAKDPRAEVVAAAVWLHGLAGELVGSGRAARSATALDVIAAVPRALATLEQT